MFLKFSDFFYSTLNLFFSFNLIDVKKQTWTLRFKTNAFHFQLQPVVKVVFTSHGKQQSVIQSNFEQDNVSQHETNCPVDQTSNCIETVLKKRFRHKTLEKEQKTKLPSERLSFPATENSLHINWNWNIQGSDSDPNIQAKTNANTHCKILI